MRAIAFILTVVAVASTTLGGGTLSTMNSSFAPRGDALCDPDGVQSSGAVYRICMPPEGSWNGDLVLFAHGYVDPNEPVAIPEDQLGLGDGPTLPEIVTSLGYAFAVTSYRQNGLAILEGLDDCVELVELFEATYGPADTIYLTGASEGGLITALGIERRPDVFDAGLSTCGPIGSFALQLGYFANMRATFDYFFDLIPGDVTLVPAEVYANWYDVYRPQLEAALEADPAVAEEIIRIARGPTDPANVVGTRISTIAGAVGYHVRASTDATEKLGGIPIGNRGIWYRGASQPLLFNLGIQRVDADPEAAANVAANYETSGVPLRPLIVMHTTGDEIIPYWQAVFYAIKALFGGGSQPFANLPVQRYGHCDFEIEEVLAGFAILVSVTEGAELVGVEELLAGPDAVRRYHALREEYRRQVVQPGSGAENRLPASAGPR